MPEIIPGLVIRAQSGFFTIQTTEGEATCQVRGKLKKQRRNTDLLAVGDRVMISLLETGKGLIEEVLPRERVLSRRVVSAGDRQREKEQVIVANPDQAVFVFACAEPTPHLRMLDRFLIAAERARLPLLICANKTDLLPVEDARGIFGIYEHIGYTVLYVSAKSGEGISTLRGMLQGKLTVFSGPSGVGKSSLLNAIQPGLALRVSHVSGSHQKGRHTTVFPELVALEGGGYVADTPGLRAIAFWDIAPEELDGYFPEIRPLVDRCQFNDCIHENTPGCAVEAAVRDGSVSPERYDSFLRLRRGEM